MLGYIRKYSWIMIAVLLVFRVTLVADAQACCFRVTKDCVGPAGPGEPIYYSGTVTNCNSSGILTEVKVTDLLDDSVLVSGVTLGPGEYIDFRGSYQPIECPSTNTVLAEAYDEWQSRKTAIAEAACDCPGGCRVTGGGNSTAGIDALGGYDGSVAEVDPHGKAASTENRYTFGGQAGANTGQQPQPKGEWTHHQMDGPYGDFVFHAGTASAPEGTEIDFIQCSDPGFCDPARHAPAKQIDFEGVGTFKNMKDSPLESVVVPGETYHWFEVHIEDLGEPGGKGKKQPLQNDPIACPPAGSDGLNDIFANCDCPDFYRIAIYDAYDPASESPNKTDIIYMVEGYIDHGNLQIHPPTGFDMN